MKNIFDILIHLEESCAKILIKKELVKHCGFGFSPQIPINDINFIVDANGLVDIDANHNYTIGLQNDGNPHFNTFSLDEVNEEERIDFLNLFTKCMENKKKWTLYMVYPQTYNEVQIEKV